MEQLKELYREWAGHKPASTERLPGAGSNRAYYRMADTQGKTVIGCVGTSAEENGAFIYLATHFGSKQLPVPNVLACSNDKLRYLQTDLGSTSLFDAIRKGREAGGHYDEKERSLLRQTIRLLPRIQHLGAQGMDFSHCYPQPRFNEEGIFFDLNYFKYCFLKTTGTDFNEVRLEADFRKLAKDLMEDGGNTFLYRDFQARNVMLCAKGSDNATTTTTTEAKDSRQETFFIDFQGGRQGPVYYDLASFLWQASARYPDSLRRELTDEYYAASREYADMPERELFDRRLSLFVLFRTLQVLGAYGFRGYFERKQHFIDSIPHAMHNVRQLLSEWAGGKGIPSPYPYLEEVLTRLTDNFTPPETQHRESTTQEAKRLVVRVFSFSYRKGIPADESGNGGGYVFDCRATHNPGRYEQYKQLTGLDEPVRRFLENDGEIATFLNSVCSLADAHVERYMQRGFTALMFAFGCTGGQHRSVYAAQHLAEHLNKKYGIEVRLCHREQGISQTLKAASKA